jgi:hypothetical protein
MYAFTSISNQRTSLRPHQRQRQRQRQRQTTHSTHTVRWGLMNMLCCRLVCRSVSVYIRALLCCAARWMDRWVDMCVYVRATRTQGRYYFCSALSSPLSSALLDSARLDSLLLTPTRQHRDPNVPPCRVLPCSGRWLELEVEMLWIIWIMRKKKKRNPPPPKKKTGNGKR